MLLKITVTQYCDVMELNSTAPTEKSRPRVLRGLVAIVVTAALVGLGIWVGSSYFRGAEGVAPSDSELSASQHTSHLVRSLRISAASNTTPPNIASIPEAAAGVEPFECGTRFSTALEDAVVDLVGVDYLSTVAGSRSLDVEPWRVQQTQAHTGAIALKQLFPEECTPQVPIVYSLDADMRFADAISVRQMLLGSDELVEEWSQLYLLAETEEEREIALSGLWQVVSWEASASPGRSPFSLVW